ncbi:response regulator [Sorangium atrum]|uniref:Response regulator n=1 Tax=Sorangium atrum TaxID=2995308 RepID=A0ABT5BZC8_9BACT|nr:response regulator [Sorangium aterium]MDC0679516.1 response regulator [Sorangium aterium]
MQGTGPVLVVDDEEGMRATLAANLELEGYEVVEARDGAHALELVKRRRFALVLSDVRMPGLDGVATFREIKRLQPELTVVLMTGFAREQLIEQGIGEGVYAVIYKPFSMEHLMRIIARALSSRGVLVVDDLPAVAESIVAGLKAAGLRAEAAYDGHTAIQRARDAAVDVCVLDLRMPSLDGVRTHEQIRRLSRGITVIAMTGHATPEMIHAFTSQGGYACLHKPFEVRELMHTIARARSDPGTC